MYKMIMIFGIFASYSMQAMQKEMQPLVDSKNPHNAIDYCVAIEEAKAAYNALPKYKCCSEQANGYINIVNTLGKEQEKHKKNKAASYFDIATCPINVDTTNNKHTLYASTPSSNKIDSYLVCKNFSKIHPNTLYSLTHIKLPNVGLAELPLQNIVWSSPYLEELDVSNNNISVITYRSDNVPFAIEGRWRYKKSDDWKGVHTLNLSHNKLESIDLDAIGILCPFIKNIDLSHNTTLNTYILNEPVAWQLQDYCCASASLTCSLPTLTIKDTPLCSTEHINKIKTAYIKAMIKARTDKGIALGFVVGFLPSLATMVPAITLTFPFSYTFNHALAVIGTGVGSVLGSWGIFTGMGSLIGKYCITPSEQDAMEKRAAEHIITQETA